MKRTLLILVLLAVVSIVVTGCQKDAYDRHREWGYRRTVAADSDGFADDVDTVLLSERPTRLTQWYNP